MGQDLAENFLAFSRDKLLGQYWPRMRGCVESLTDEQIWWRPNDSSNSVGNLLLHLNGNVTQWLVASFNETKDERNRPAEFHETEHLPGAALLARLEETMRQVSDVLGRLTEADLLAVMEIQWGRVTGMEAIYQAIEHFGLHYGQVVYITKMLRDVDLGFYKHLNKTGYPPPVAKS